MSPSLSGYRLEEDSSVCFAEMVVQRSSVIRINIQELSPRDRQTQPARPETHQCHPCTLRVPTGAPRSRSEGWDGTRLPVGTIPSHTAISTLGFLRVVQGLCNFSAVPWSSLGMLTRAGGHTCFSGTKATQTAAPYVLSAVAEAGKSSHVR